MATLVEKRVPARAMAFAAELQLQPADDGETKIRQGKIVARTGGEAFHWYWGRCVHDLAGMNLPKPRVPLDYCHNPCDVVGFAEGFDAAAGQLECDASLVTHRPEDRAAKLMADSDAGVPYEASILQSAAGLVVEWVDAGATVDVNGQSFSGPGVVFRQWTLRGLATCPQGSDAATSSEFSAGPLAGEVTISNFPGGFSMSTAPAPSPAPAPAPAAPANPPADTGLAANPPANPPVAPVVAPMAHTGQQFMDAFGEKGAVWFAQGKTFAEAQTLFHAEVAAKNKELTEQVQALTEANQKLRGATEPVSFTGAPPDGAKQKQGFAGLIKLPGAAK